jgi:hypothetical protein
MTSSAPIVEPTVVQGQRPRTSRKIRPLTENDLPQVADLYQRAFGRPIQNSADFLQRVFFGQPWRDDALPSLAYEDGIGRIVGCLGIMPRPMTFHGNRIQAAVGHHFIVEQSKKGTFAGVELARRFLGGPQDLALAEGNEFSRQIWEYLGGSTSPLYSLCWTRALRPAQYALTFLKNRGLPPSAALTLKPACQAVDATFDLVPQHLFRIRTPQSFSDDLDGITMHAYLSAFAMGRALQPVYDPMTLDWLLQTLEEKRYRGALYRVAVRTGSGRPLGWYLYYLGSSGIAEVLQVGGKDDSILEVLHHLFYHAWRRGAVAATGPLDPRLCSVFTAEHCGFHRPDNGTMLMYSADPEILNTIQSGDAFLSRLEREWWIE